MFQFLPAFSGGQQPGLVVRSYGVGLVHDCVSYRLTSEGLQPTLRLSLFPYFCLFKVFYHIWSLVWVKNLDLFLELDLGSQKAAPVYVGSIQKGRRENPPALYDNICNAFTTVIKEELSGLFFPWDFLYCNAWLTNSFRFQLTDILSGNLP